MEFILTLKFFASSVDIDKECENIFERVDRPPPPLPTPAVYPFHIKVTEYSRKVYLVGLSNRHRE